LLPAIAQADPPLYRVTSLGELSGDPGVGQSEAYGLNDLGQVVGWSHAYEQGQIVSRAFLWLPVDAYELQQGMHNLGIISGDPLTGGSEARDINESGQVVGTSSAADGVFAFVWLPEAFDDFPEKQPWKVPSFDSTLRAEGWALDDGQPPHFHVVGWGGEEYPDPTGARNIGFVWDSNNPTQLQRVDPPTDHDWTNCYIYGIRPDGGLRRVLAGEGGYGGQGLGNFGAIGLDWFFGRDALTLGVPWDDDPYRAQARDASDEGQLVGWGEDPEDENYPFLDRALFWELVTAQPVNLHAVVNITFEQETRAEAIARPGGLPYVVGWNASTNHALLWKRDGQGEWSVEDLNNLIGTHAQIDWELVEAHDINNGTSIPGWGEFPTPWIVGWGLYGTYPNDKHRAFLLSTAKDCPQDLDFDNDIDTEDLLILLANWGYCPEGEICWSDIDMNGEVNTADLLDLLGHWGQDCGAGGGQIPRNVQDCIDKIGFGDPVALEACIQAVTGGFE